MALKTAVKAARKFWPMTSPALEHAISYLNDEGGEGFTQGPITLDVAARELGVPVQAADNAPVLVTNQASGPLVMPMQTYEPEPVRENVEVVSTQSSAQENGFAEVPASAQELDPAMVERIKKVVDRAFKNGSWEAAREWVISYITDHHREYAIAELDRAQAAKAA